MNEKYYFHSSFSGGIQENILNQTFKNPFKELVYLAEILLFEFVFVSQVKTNL